MSKYIRINDSDDIIEINDEIIGEKHYCWNCKYFSPPQGCTNMFIGTVPFSFCDDWSRASDKELESIKKEINECCKVNKIKRINKYKGNIRACKRDIDTNFRQILKILDKEDEDEDEKELRPEFIK